MIVCKKPNDMRTVLCANRRPLATYRTTCSQCCVQAEEHAQGTLMFVVKNGHPQRYNRGYVENASLCVRIQSLLGLNFRNKMGHCQTV